MLLSLFNSDASRTSPQESMKWRPGGFPGGHGGVDGQAGGRQPSLELAVGVTPPGGAKLPAWLPQPHLVQDNVAPVWVQPQFSVPPAWHFGSHQQFIYRLYFIFSWLNTTLIWKTAPLNTRQLHNSTESFLDICRASSPAVIIKALGQLWRAAISVAQTEKIRCVMVIKLMSGRLCWDARKELLKWLAS